MNKTLIAVDLDGSLVNSNTLHESLMLLVKSNPLALFLLPLWAIRGKAYFKQRLSDLVIPDPALLPYNTDLVSWLQDQRQLGREIVLCTAADQKIAKYLGIFDLVLASDGLCNLRGETKTEKLLKVFPGTPFSYVGDAQIDLAVWKSAASAIVVTNSQGLKNSCQQVCPVEKEFSQPKTNFKSFIELLRPHQWAKNLLLFAPALASNQIGNTALILELTQAFVAFCLCSSSIYIINDLMDLENDRKHPTKCKRPFSSGRLPINQGVILLPFLLVVSALVSLEINTMFVATISVYFLLTILYTFFLKNVVLLDCLILAGAYTLRIVGGSKVISSEISFWMVSFSVFLFLSLAYLKRYTELIDYKTQGNQVKVSGRAYTQTDAPFIQILGVSAGFISVLVLALYIDSTASAKIYFMPELMWAAVIVLLYWINWMWLKAHRGEMHSDPVIFALTDSVSLCSGVLFVLIVIFSAAGIKL
jgi:4-hydroxybenzoate polyprenyltransferase